MYYRPKLGEILVEAGVIDELQLAAALGEQRRWGRRLGVTLVKMGMVEEGHLIRALAKQLDLPVASLAGKRISEEVIALVPARIASKHGVIPLFVKREEKGPAQLFLGMEDPSNLEVLDDLSFRTGLEIHRVMVTPTDLGAAIDRYYHSKAEDGSHSGRTGTGAPMGLPSLRRIEGDPAKPLPAEPPPSDSEVDRAEGLDVMPASRAPEIELGDEIVGTAAESLSPIPPLAPLAPLAPSAADVPQSVLEDVSRALRESERTRFVAKALTQLLIEKGLLSLEEIQARVGEIKQAASAGNPADA
jgi:hypothetical protein